jgi:hypothetical protein
MSNFKPIIYTITEKGCWHCTSHVTAKNRYANIQINGKMKLLHRHYYELYKGEIPPGIIIRHTCDNTFCINPEHLITGTQKQNAQDMMERERGCGLFTNSEVREIRKSFTSNKNKAKELNVKTPVIYNIRMGFTYKHIPFTVEEIEIREKRKTLEITRLSKKEVLEVFYSKKSRKELMLIYNLTYHQVVSIKTKKSYVKILKNL